VAFDLNPNPTAAAFVATGQQRSRLVCHLFRPYYLGTPQSEDPVDNKETIYPLGVYGKDPLMKWRSAKAAG
jgi:hypothetical protein